MIVAQGQKKQSPLFQHDDALRLLEAIKYASIELKRRHWIKGSSAVDSEGKETFVEADAACHFDIYGLILKSLFDTENLELIQYMVKVMHTAAQDVSGDEHVNIFEFNDDENTDLQKAIAVCNSMQELVSKDFDLTSNSQ